MAAPKKVDYARIEPGWRAGILSPRQLAMQYSEATGEQVSHTAIVRHFGKLGVPRDLAAKVQAKAEAMVSQAMVTGKVTRETMVSDATIIDQNAETVATVRIAHRTDIGRGRSLAMSLLAELEHQTANQDLYDQLADLLLPSEDEGSDAGKERARKLREAYSRALSLGGRTKTLKDLADTLRILIDKEREAFGIGKGDEGAQTPLAEALRDFLGSLHQSSAKLPMAPRT